MKKTAIIIALILVLLFCVGGIIHLYIEQTNYKKTVKANIEKMANIEFDIQRMDTIIINIKKDQEALAVRMEKTNEDKISEEQSIHEVQDVREKIKAKLENLKNNSNNH